MATPKPAKTFDAVAIVRRIREQIHEETKHMSPEERIAFFRRESEAFEAEKRERQEAQPDEGQ